MISVICILISFRPQACGPELMLWLFFTLGDEEKVPQKSRDTYFLLNCTVLFHLKQVVLAYLEIK